MAGALEAAELEAVASVAPAVLGEYIAMQCALSALRQRLRGIGGATRHAG